MPESTPNIPEKFLSPYNPEEVEKRTYAMWEESGMFNPDNLAGQVLLDGIWWADNLGALRPRWNALVSG